MRIAVVGAGAIGSVIGAGLTRGGHSVVLLGRPGIQGSLSHQRRVLLRAPDETFTSTTVTVVDDPSSISSVDVALVLVKTVDTASALSRIKPYVQRDLVFATLQNGLSSAERIRSTLGADAHVLPAVTYLAAMRSEPDFVVQTGMGPTYIGFEDPDDAKTAGQLAHVFTTAGFPAFAVPDIEVYIWQKAGVNAAINGLTALGEFPNGAILESPKLLAAAFSVADEVVAVARARGIDVGNLREAIVETAAATSGNRSSMLQDLEAGRPTEVAAIHGAIREEGLKRGLETPTIDLLDSLITAKSEFTRMKEPPVVDYTR